jgi:MscS family membrane protein
MLRPWGSAPARLALGLLLVLAWSSPLGAQPAPPAAPATVEVAPDSPRASLLAYLLATREGRYDDAARYLELTPEQLPRAPELARHLKVVLDHHVWFDLAEISPASMGAADDKLAPGLDEVGKVPNEKGGSDPVRMQRITDASGARWVFTPVTVAKIDEWYADMPGTWLREYLPDAMFRPGPRELLWWQWAALPVVLIFAFLGGLVLAPATKWLLARIFSRTRTTVDDAILARIGGPLRLAWTLALIYLAMPSMDLVGPAHVFVHKVLRGFVFLTFFWTLSRCADIVGQVIIGSPWALARPEARPLLSLAVRAGKVAVLAMAVIAVIAELGYPVASLLAGLGLGGLAFALAAQKTVENVFGSVSLGMDQPMREGEFVRVEDFVGTVESIGLRSTRFRTLDRTLITIPNGKLADMRLETFAARDRIRFATTIGVVYSTSEAQMRALLAGIEKILRGHEKCWQEAVVVRFKEFGASALELEIMCWYMTQDYGEFTLIKQELMLKIMGLVQEVGSAFAYPSTSLYVESLPPPK